MCVCVCVCGVCVCVVCGVCCVVCVCCVCVWCGVCVCVCVCVWCRWGKRAAHNRAQVVYYIAENLELRHREVAQRIADMTGEVM